MPPARRSLRDRNRTAIEEPYPVADDAPSPNGPVPAPEVARREKTGSPAVRIPGEGDDRSGETSASSVVDQTPAPLGIAPSLPASTSPSSAPSDRPSRGARGRRPGARKGRDGAAQAAREGDTSMPVARILYLPEDLIEALRIYRATHAMTNTQVALRALNSTYRQIPDLLEHETRDQVIVGDLFDEVIPTPTRSNRQVEITPTAAQLDTIDPLVTSTGARDRSHLFALAIRRFLTDAGLLQP